MASVQGRGWRHLTSRLAEGNWTLTINLLLFICYGAERKEGIKSESTVIAQVILEVGEISLGGTSSSKEETELGVSVGMKGCAVKS